MTENALQQHDGYHSTPESRISIVSVMSHEHMVQEINQHSRVNTSMPLDDLTAMPKKPKPVKRGVSANGKL
jgi:hypothetical protein